MNMDLSIWRFRSRIVAYVDLGFSIVELVITVLAIFLGGVGSAVLVAETNKHEIKNVTHSEITVFLVIVWVSLAIMFITICVDLWAIIMLLKATKLGADPGMALHRAQIWRIVNVVFLIVSVIFYAFISTSLISLALDIIFRGIVLFIVSKFIEELKHASFSGPTSSGLVIVNK